jgi:MoaA/NifB/PqqE/SkfB family radical SAM enzyme
VTGSPYSPLKIFRHQIALRSLSQGQHVAPIHVQILPTNVCQQACRECAYRLPGYTSNELFSDTDEIPTETLLEIVSDCGAMGVKAIEITGGGEPLLSPGFVPMCEAILDRGIDLSLVTNGVRWNHDLTKLLANAKWVRFSIDAGTPETYADYRRSNKTTYHRVRDSVRDLCAYRDGEELIVGVGFVVTADNWREVLVAAENAREDGADNIRISAAFQSAGASYFAPFAKEAAKLCKEAESLTDKSFRVFNRFEDRLDDLEQGHPTFSDCWFQRVCTYIGANLSVFRCCVLGYSLRGQLGSLKEQRFSSLWFSEETKRRLFEFDARSCPRCLYSRTNENIAYAVAASAQHENFIG